MIWFLRGRLQWHLRRLSFRRQCHADPLIYWDLNKSVICGIHTCCCIYRLITRISNLLKWSSSTENNIVSMLSYFPQISNLCNRWYIQFLPFSGVPPLSGLHLSKNFLNCSTIFFCLWSPFSVPFFFYIKIVIISFL